MIKEISKKEFEERFAEVSTYGLDNNGAVYLDNGVVLIDNEWNGEVYTVKEDGKERTFQPVYKQNPEDEDSFEIVGYEEW